MRKWSYAEQNSPLKEHLRKLEEQLLQPGVRKSTKQLEKLLADDFVEFGSSGRVFNKQQIINGLSTEPKIKMSLIDFAIKQLAEDVVLATYRVLKHEDMKFSLRSSIWKLNEGQWQMVFHQGTPSTAP